MNNLNSQYIYLKTKLNLLCIINHIDWLESQIYSFLNSIHLIQSQFQIRRINPLIPKKLIFYLVVHQIIFYSHIYLAFIIYNFIIYFGRIMSFIIDTIILSYS